MEGIHLMRKTILALLLCVLLAALSGCAAPQLIDAPTQAPPGFGVPTATTEPTAAPQG
jgi:hypothetical protein